MRKLLLCVVMLLAFAATARPTTWDLGLPANTEVDVHGNGGFDQFYSDPYNPRGIVLDTSGRPLTLLPGTELYGVAKINNIVKVGPATILWDPAVAEPSGQMTLSFWDAFVTSSFVAYDGPTQRIIATDWSDSAYIAIIQGDSNAGVNAYNPSPGPGLFDVATGHYPTVFDPTNATESLFLLLKLDGNTSTVVWNKITNKIISGVFTSYDVSIVGGSGASQFANAIGAQGETLTMNFLPGNWFYNADADIELNTPTVPAPTALISLFSGLALLGGYRLRRRS